MQPVQSRRFDNLMCTSVIGPSSRANAAEAARSRVEVAVAAADKETANAKQARSAAETRLAVMQSMVRLPAGRPAAAAAAAHCVVCRGHGRQLFTILSQCHTTRGLPDESCIHIATSFSHV
jgi:hypothetical protein